MSEAFFVKGPGGCLIPVGPDAERLVANLPAGAGLWTEAWTDQNPKLRRKLFKLLHLAFDAWEPQAALVVGDEVARKDFDLFRKDVMILAGHCARYVNGKGEVRLEAKSLSPAKCEGVELEAVYRKVLDVVWTRILRHVRYESRRDVERVIEELITYESGDHAAYIL